MAEEHDVGAGPLIFRKDAIPVDVEQMHDGLEGILSVTVLENFHVGVFREAALDALRELHGAVMRIVVAHESAYEADHDTGRDGGLRAGGRRSLGSCGYGSGAEQNCEGDGQGAR